MHRNVVFGRLGPAELGTARQRRVVVAMPVGELGSTAVFAALSPKLPPYQGD